MSEINYKRRIYYYSAWNGEKIGTDAIIDGLNWMVECGVKKVNISMSSSKYSKKLEQWIKEHRDRITIYASYSNNINTVADYPAMYKFVVGVGSDSKIEYKSCDIHYRNNRILIWNKGKIYSVVGNSYLSPYSMITSK